MAQYGRPYPPRKTAKKSPKAPFIALAFVILFGSLTGCDAETSTDASKAKPEKTVSGPASTDSGTTKTAPSKPTAETQEPSTPSATATETPGTSEQTPSQIDKEAEPDPKISADGQSALAVAQQLTVKGRAPRTGYSRSLFGSAWKDIDRNGCDQRNDILNRDLTNMSHKPGTNKCVVTTGTLVDPFSGKTINFERGEKTSQKVQIDHVVALSDAWQKGAQQWDQSKREQFANDPLNLLAVDGPLNGQKGDGDVATWLPPNKSFRCQYVAQVVGVKHAYSLWVTQAEQDAMVRVLSTCPNEKIPTGKIAPHVTPQKAQEPKPKAAAPKPKPKPSSAPKPKPAPKPKAPQADVYYKNCTAVWDAIGGPISKGEPGYGKHLDRDGDGTGCEYKPR